MSSNAEQVLQGDSLSVMAAMPTGSVDMAYLDPPFFTNKKHSMVTRDRATKFGFSDLWDGLGDYSEFMELRLRQVHRVLKDTGSIFVHCDKNANYLLRALLDKIFGDGQFRSEIVWTYRRWSNSARGLLPAHQTIFFYSKTGDYKFNSIYNDYSETTNIDQILQLRSRDEHGVSTYATDESGDVIYGGAKKGVPLSDVWDIPFLNPKARERAGYPTQKPILLLERIVEISTDPGDLVIDPFCGSGTALVAAKIMDRRAIGIDVSEEAVALTRKRLESPVKTESSLLKKGRDAYANADETVLAMLSGLDYFPVQRNQGIDAFLKDAEGNSLVPIRVQRPDETLAMAAHRLDRAARSKNIGHAILVRTHEDEDFLFEIDLPASVAVVDSTAFQVKRRLAEVMIKAIVPRTAIQTHKKRERYALDHKIA